MRSVSESHLPLVVLLALAVAGGSAVHSPAYPAVTERVSVSSAGEQTGLGAESRDPSISGDGRFVAFDSDATNLVAGDTNGTEDVFVHDRLTGITERVSVSSAGEQANARSAYPSISADGRFVAFDSDATNLVPWDTNGASDVFLRDRLTGETNRVSVSSAGLQGNGASGSGHISADGTFVAFTSAATNLVPGDTNGHSDAFVHDRSTGTTQRLSVSTAGQQANEQSWASALSADGGVVAFHSRASNLVAGDTNGYTDVFLRDITAGITERISVSSAGEQADSYSEYSAAVSADGRFVAFESNATNLTPGPQDRGNLFVRDRAAGTTELVSTPSLCEPEQWPMGALSPSLSADGRFVALQSGCCTPLTPPWTSDCIYDSPVLIYDRLAGVTERASVSSTGEVANGSSFAPSLSADGRFVAFASWADNLVSGDTNGRPDVFVHDMGPLWPLRLRIAINGLESCTNSRNVTLSFLFPDGCMEMRLRDDPGDWGAWEPCVAQKAWTLPAGDGAKTVCMQCRDAQGNVSLEACDDIVLDTTPPANPGITISGGAACTDRLEVALALSATDAYEVRFSNDAQTWSAWSGYAPIRSWMLSDARGLKTVSAQYRDSCGNESAIVSDSIWRILFDDVRCQYPPRPYVEVIAQRGIVTACTVSPTWYCPYYAATRAFIAQALCRAAGKTWLDSTTPRFADVPKSHPAYGWIERLADQGSWGGTPVTDGCGWQGSQKLFCPDGNVPREHAAKFLCRATGKPPMPTCSGVFADVPPVRSFCGFVERLADAASWPGGIAVTRGCGQSGTTRWYCPDRALSRGEMAVFIVRAFGIPM